ncbi:MAG TPA: TetR family transcriptional regulator [Lacisediminihabitans sp.]|uniref:TetR/AcrR family transcriptional regulator n=1 Tax=Lacisediminihabitans sp. TaxID=2787631 RepID=UPI002ED9525A
MTLGLREQHKQRTREALSTAAMKLFAVHGFDEVTIPQIAEAAGVAKMTVTNYFPRKEDLVFDQAEPTILSLAHAVAIRAPGESALTAIRLDCIARITAHDVTLGPPSANFAQLVHDSRVLTARIREIAELREQALGDAIAAETGQDTLRQRVIATQLASVHRALFTETSRRVLTGESHQAVFGELATSTPAMFDLMEASLGDYLIKEPISPPRPN